MVDGGGGGFETSEVDRVMSVLIIVAVLYETVVRR